MKHSFKTVELISVKALGPEQGEPEGTFEALFAVFGNVDKIGDRINGKAFDDTLEHWRSKAEATGVRLPVIFAHDWGNPMSYLGSADPNDVRVVPGVGVYAKGMVEHMDTNPVARQVYNLMKSKVITEWSFGYSVPKGGQAKASDGAMDLNRLDLFEFGPCLRGINPDTLTLGVKSAMEADARKKSYVDVEVDGSFEEIQESLRDALREAYPPPEDNSQWRSVNMVATTASKVTYQICSSGEDDDQMFSADYSIDENGDVTLGEPTEVQAAIVPKAEKEDGVLSKAFELAAAAHPAGVPPEVTASILADAEAYVTEQTKSEEEIRAKEWNSSVAAFTDQQYVSSCILNRAMGDDSFVDAPIKERYGLPIAKAGHNYADEPDPVGVATAATFLPGMKASAESVRDAAKKLERAFVALHLEVPENVTDLANSDEIVYEKGQWHGEQSLDNLSADNEKSASELERTMYEQSIANSEASVGPLSADALEAAHLDEEMTDRLLAQLA